MPAAIPFVAGAVASSMGATMVVTAVVGAVAGAVVAAEQGEDILKGALLGAVGGLAGDAVVAAFGGAGALGSQLAPSASVVGETAAGATTTPLAATVNVSGTALPATNAAADIGSTIATNNTPLIDPSIASLSQGGTGLASSTANAGLSGASGVELLNPATVNGNLITERLAGLGTQPSGGGLLDSIGAFAEKNPTMALGAVQTAGQGLAGMAQASAQEEQLAYKKSLDDERRRNASYAKVPTTTWK